MALLGLFGLAAVWGSLAAAFQGWPQTVLVVAAGVATAAYGWFIATNDDFIYAVYFNAAAMASILALHIATWTRHHDRASAWMFAGIAVSALAAVLQASGISMAAQFNNNDLFHVLQIVAMYLFYRAAMLL